MVSSCRRSVARSRCTRRGAGQFLHEVARSMTRDPAILPRSAEVEHRALDRSRRRSGRRRRGRSGTRRAASWTMIARLEVRGRDSSGGDRGSSNTTRSLISAHHPSIRTIPRVGGPRSTPSVGQSVDQERASPGLLGDQGLGRRFRRRPHPGLVAHLDVDDPAMDDDPDVDLIVRLEPTVLDAVGDELAGPGGGAVEHVSAEPGP